MLVKYEAMVLIILYRVSIKIQFY